MRFGSSGVATATPENLNALSRQVTRHLPWQTPIFMRCKVFILGGATTDIFDRRSARSRPQFIPRAECVALTHTELGSQLTRNFHLRCIELFGTKAGGQFNALKLPRIFQALQLQRLECGMSWNGAVKTRRAREPRAYADWRSRIFQSSPASASTCSRASASLSDNTMHDRVREPPTCLRRAR